ncbi:MULTISPECIES: 4-hydroxy-tetrahydrodipicolinate synthase [Thermotoga]|jgi:4-hydroxy-tetrahydrodipicolinate synthase|uniref:4-hydroxy-tetrahydrodipicolinate synthase n=1 Tax=Thermotoga neapolitana (strain ATCC 49049 / DSM 4359 / NBRC 107923 / NS-E) TaxID=309803 RepID=DAPA_THENN|nr:MULTISPECIES: 4-hydroxy-tetrahydrodipicolinate synthase [Thermotoga]B9K865.1 RecName: Full=4-hydroxy-tetrahydrodipicolinate synthase; Short=HTPA synthase [Thermotoga neapolitana DSM 4359]MDK2785786.1 4-hydroxy-tetrahydrodipicolinate synthase [Thermotoga sp.]HBF11573.1 4-hydroxy-tetrahydrodipicolinate synthase [Thermotoga neapolitana]ACM23148.1 Dihydrodipicolinate synthase [Thermotoga neapolitana DSM 4359]AJG41061.1 4-hydroxy-tetrahydrodipicolinate synthase [Thermotoga sp. RQ7]KFZ21649.1 di
MFRGVGTAIVTPFKNGELDLEAYERLVRYQLDGGVSALIVLGTTGEAPTVNDDERERLVSKTLEIVDGKIPVIVGAGTNSTEKTLKLVKQAEKLGADGVLIVTPYYNKPTQEGLYQHYKYISERTDLKIIVYNVPGRTGVNVLPETAARIASDLKNVVGIKEANGDIDQIDRTVTLTKSARSDFMVWSGNDDRTFYLLCAGGDGVISVVSNVAPKQMSDLCAEFFSGNIEKAREIHRKLRPLMKALFVETNPIPVKAALSLMGYVENELRLPLVPASEKTVELLKGVLRESGLL